jgi:transposase
MSAPRNLRNDIIQLRNEGKSYREIQEILKCSKGSINYICKKTDLTDTGMKIHPLSVETKKQIAEFCKTHTSKQATVHFGLGLSSIKKYRKYQSKE